MAEKTLDVNFKMGEHAQLQTLPVEDGQLVAAIKEDDESALLYIDVDGKRRVVGSGESTTPTLQEVLDAGNVADGWFRLGGGADWTEVGEGAINFATVGGRYGTVHQGGAFFDDPVRGNSLISPVMGIFDGGHRVLSANPLPNMNLTPAEMVTMRRRLGISNVPFSIPASAWVASQRAHNFQALIPVSGNTPDVFASVRFDAQPDATEDNPDDQMRAVASGVSSLVISVNDGVMVYANTRPTVALSGQMQLS